MVPVAGAVGYWLHRGKSKPQLPFSCQWRTVFRGEWALQAGSRAAAGPTTPPERLEEEQKRPPLGQAAPHWGDLVLVFRRVLPRPPCPASSNPPRPLCPSQKVFRQALSSLDFQDPSLWAKEMGPWARHPHTQTVTPHFNSCPPKSRHLPLSNRGSSRLPPQAQSPGRPLLQEHERAPPSLAPISWFGNQVKCGGPPASPCHQHPLGL